MITALVLGALVTVGALLIARPLVSGSGGASGSGDTASDGDAPPPARALLTQLRDLDEDLAVGRLTEEEYAQLRAPVETMAAQVLRQAGHRGRTRGRTDDRPSGTSRRPGRLAKLGVATTVLVMVAGLAAAVVLLDRSVTSRESTGAVRSDAAPGPSDVAAPGPRGQEGPSDQQLTEEQVAAVNAAVSAVRENPKSVAAHLRLAHAYAAAGQNQLSTIEFLAVTRLDKANPEANTALALLAFLARQHDEAKKLADTALREHPEYPEALYTRGLIQMMGLKDLEAAKADLQTYLSVAPFGSHRADVAILLAIAKGEEGS